MVEAGRDLDLAQKRGRVPAAPQRDALHGELAPAPGAAVGDAGRAGAELGAEGDVRRVDEPPRGRAARARVVPVRPAHVVFQAGVGRGREGGLNDGRAGRGRARGQGGGAAERRGRRRPPHTPSSPRRRQLGASPVALRDDARLAREGGFQVAQRGVARGRRGRRARARRARVGRLAPGGVQGGAQGGGGLAGVVQGVFRRVGARAVGGRGHGRGAPASGARPRRVGP